MKIVGFFGAPGAGKSFASAAVLKHFPHYNKLSLADPLYGMMNVLMGRTVDRSEDKMIPHPELCGKSLRYAMQTLGTDWAREYIDEDFLVKNLLARAEADGYTHLVIDDVRFNNEFKELKLRGAEIILVDNPLNDTEYHDHVSEVDWKNWVPSATLLNPNDSGIEQNLVKVFRQLSIT
jgi:hypothetical protein